MTFNDVLPFLAIDRLFFRASRKEASTHSETEYEDKNVPYDLKNNHDHPFLNASTDQR